MIGFWTVTTVILNRYLDLPYGITYMYELLIKLGLFTE
jgi:hypothetical protein